jgi:1-acyl-sn-glycerol-3-phosphate acyltransferase
MRKIYFWPPLILQTFIWPITYTLFFILFLSLKVKGLENIKDLKRGVIFAVNHTGELDAILVPASLPFLSHLMPMFYTSREKGYYKRSGWRQHIYGGLFFNAWGAYKVYIGENNYEVALRNHIEILEDKGSVCVFPEGHTTRDGNLSPAKGGVAFLAHKTGTPIIPVSISGLFGLSPKRFFTGKHKVTLCLGKPLYAKDILGEGNNFTHLEYKAGAQKVMDEISRIMESR